MKRRAKKRTLARIIQDSFEAGFQALDDRPRKKRNPPIDPEQAAEEQTCDLPLEAPEVSLS